MGSVSKKAGVMEGRETVAAPGLDKRGGEELRKQERRGKDERKGETWSRKQESSYLTHNISF